MMQMLILWCKYEFKLSNKADLPLKTRSWLLPLPNLELKVWFHEVVFQKAISVESWDSLLLHWD